MEFRNKHKTKIIIAVLLLIAVLALCFGIWAIWFRAPKVLDPDYAAKEPDKNAEQIEGDNSGEKLEVPDGGGAMSLIYSKEVEISLSDSKATFLVGNPAESTVYLVAEIVIQNRVIAQSGAIKPGYRLTELDLAAGAKDVLQAGGYDGKIVLYMYNSENDERAVLNSEIIVTVKMIWEDDTAASWSNSTITVKNKSSQSIDVTFGYTSEQDSKGVEGYTVGTIEGMSIVERFVTNSTQTYTVEKATAGTNGANGTETTAEFTITPYGIYTGTNKDAVKVGTITISLS